MPAAPHDSTEAAIIDGIRTLDNLHAAGAYESIIALSAALIDQAPDVYPLYLLRGAAFKGLGETESAIACFRKVLELEPGEKAALVKLGLCLQATGRLDEAISYFAESFYLYPSRDTGELVLAAMRAGTIDRALVEAVMRGVYDRFFDRDPRLEVRESPLVHIADWCERHKARVIECECAGEVRLVDADGVPLAPYRIEATRFFVIPNAAVIAGWECVMAPTGEALYSPPALGGLPKDILATSGVFVPSATFYAAGRVFHPWTENIVDIEEDVLFLGAPRLHHFGHWVFDYLPKLRAWRQEARAPLKVFTLDLPAAQRETLAMFGVRPQDLIEGESGKVYRFRSLTVGFILSLYSPAPSTARFLHQALAVQRTPAPVGDVGTGYFLERSQTARGRAIANQEELAATLAEFQIRTVRRPEFSVAQQNALFSEAGIIVCPFGTDLITVFQVRPGTDFVVLQFQDLGSIYEGIAEHFFRYCAILGMHVRVVECQLTAREGKIQYHGDMIVDCAALREAIVKIRGRRAAARRA